MQKTRLLHAEILAALGAAGHGALVPIADANPRLLTRSGASARRVSLGGPPAGGPVTVGEP